MTRVRALALALLFGLTDLAAADLTTGRDKLVAGDYKTAISELTKISGKDRSTARIMLARAQIATGDYAGAEGNLTPIATGKDPVAAEARMALADLRRITGRLADARRDLEALYKDRPDDRAVRTELGKLRALTGDNLGAKALFDLTIAESDKNKLDLDNPIDMIQLAEAAKHTGQYKLANDAYREAVKLDPKQTDAGVAWADLFLQKYAAQLAEQTLEDVFKINPNHPDGHAAMAEVIMETRYDLAAVKHHLDKVFEINPKNARGLKVRAAIEIDGNQWEAAQKTLDGVLAVNKEDVEALSMKATIAWLRDDVKTYEAEKAKVFAINPKYADLYRIVSRSAVREHRYVEAIELEKEAVKVKPDYYEAMAGAGLGYLRLGMEKEGIEWLDKSWAGDQYNVRTYNTRNLFRNTIPKEYSVANSKSFRIRYHNEEKAVFARYLEPTMERAFADMSKRYGFTPKTPVALELYADPQRLRRAHESACPNIGALGVCFGQSDHGDVAGDR
jgi:tetratricopeptide (TPR) repeat protein